jgi:alpha-galactosidase
MGWNSWNKFQTRIDDRTVREIADALVVSGLRDAGYRYVVVDDGWQGVRDKSGVLRPNSGFPDMAALGSYLHERGLRFGIYSSPGPKTCAGFEGSWAHEEADARMFASWGVDFLKYDWCSAGLEYELKDMGDAYAKMALALRATGRPIVYSVCQYGMFRVAEWAAAAGGNLWRTTGDIGNSWSSVSAIGFNQNSLEQSARPGGWNDPDMLEVGNGGMSLEEERSHFTLWAMLAAPLFLGNDVRTMTPEVRAILSNRDVIAINQDALGRQASRVEHKGDGEMWLKPLAGGEFALALFNKSDAPVQTDVVFAELGWPSYVEVRDVWKGDEFHRVHAGFAKTMKRHECALYRVRIRR